jgi:hypothetical protein
MNLKFNHTLVLKTLRRFKNERWLMIFEFISLIIIAISIFLLVMQILNTI